MHTKLRSFRSIYLSSISIEVIYIHCMFNKKNNLLGSSFFTNLLFVLFSFFLFLFDTVLLMLLYEYFIK